MPMRTYDSSRVKSIHIWLLDGNTYKENLMSTHKNSKLKSEYFPLKIEWSLYIYIYIYWWTGQKDFSKEYHYNPPKKKTIPDSNIKSKMKLKTPSWTLLKFKGKLY